MIEWLHEVSLDPADVEAEYRGLVALLAAFELFRSLPPAGQVQAIAAFRTMRGRVAKPRTGPLQPLAAPGD